MSARTSLGVLVAVLWFAGVGRASVEPDRRVSMHVTEIAGSVAFVDAGDADGLAAGMPVRFEPARGAPVVLAVNAKTAAIELGGATAAVGDALFATRATPRVSPKLADNTAQWPDPVLPASRGASPAEIPLGLGERRVAITIIGSTFGAVGQGYRRGDGELRAIGSFELVDDAPLGADLDAGARVYSDGYAHSRTPLLVRAALVRYGDPSSPDVAIGRLRYAATSLGMLDGGRAVLHYRDLELAAFGGLVPDPISGKPDTTASRFGTELIYRDDHSALRPRIAIVAHGSTWDGKLDERRVNVAASIVHGGTWLDTWAEVQSFAHDNPFGASGVEVVGAGASAEWRRSDAHVGADLTYLVPERSLRIAALVPEWLCTRLPDLSTAGPERCAGGDRQLASTVSGGVRSGAWAIDGAASIAYQHATEITVGGSGYLRGELRRGIGSVHATASASRAAFATWISGEVGAGIAPSRRVDATIAYRLERLDEKPARLVFGTTPDLVHSIVADVHATITPTLELGIFTLGSFGANREVLASLLTLAWRP